MDGSNTLLRRLLIGSGIPLLAFLITWVIVAATVTKLIDAIGREEHSLKVLVAAERQSRELDSLRSAGSAMTFYEEPCWGDVEAANERFIVANDTLTQLVNDSPIETELTMTIRQLECDLFSSLKVARQRFLNDPIVPTLIGLRALADQRAADLEPLRKELNQRTAEFEATEKELLDQRHQLARSQWRGAVVTAGLLLALALMIGIGSCFMTARSVTRPVQRLREAALGLLKGNYRVVTPSGPAEIAELISRFNQTGLALIERTTLLEEQETRYRTYIGSSSAVLWTANSEGLVVTDIPGWISYTGQDPQQVRGLGWIMAVHPDDKAAFERKWLDAVNRQVVFDHECRLRGRAGEYRDFACRAVPVSNHDASVREWIGTCTDITDLRRQEDLRRDKEAAEASSRAKSEFLTRMSHELRTPLNAVIGMSKMLSTQRFGNLNPKQADYLSDITQSGQHLLALVNDILDLAKVEAGKMELNPEIVAANHVIATTISPLRALADQKRLTIELSGPNDDDSLLTDRSRFKQILTNLLSNAIKFTPDGGTISVTWQWLEESTADAKSVSAERARGFKLEVGDTGIGIPEADQALIWGEFQQLKPGQALTNQGTGLGLALTRRLVQLLGGHISLQSQLNVGSTFTVVLPHRLRPFSPSTADLQLDLPASQSIALVIEDYPATNKLMCDWLDELGLKALQAFDGATGLNLAKQSRPDLIVLDIHLPDIDGWEVLNTLKADPTMANIPVLITTVSDDKSPAGQIGSDDFLIKPVDRLKFIQRVQRLLPRITAPESREVVLLEGDMQEQQELTRVLEQLDFDVHSFENIQAAQRHLEMHRPRLLIIDTHSPSLGGVTFIEQLRRKPMLEPIPIMVTYSGPLTATDRRRFEGLVQSLLDKNLLTAHRLRRQLVLLGLIQDE